MASKKEIFKEAMSICERNKAPEALTKALAELLEPKKGGGAPVNWDEFTKKDADGNVTYILDSISGKWLPATSEFFYTDTQGKGCPGTDRLKRLSKEGELIRRQHARAIAATEKAVMTDVLSKAITPEQGKAMIDKAHATKPDFSKMRVK